MSDTIEMRLPASAGATAIWSPAVEPGMVGQITTLEFDGERRQVRVVAARVDRDDPHYIYLTLELL